MTPEEQRELQAYRERDVARLQAQRLADAIRQFLEGGARLGSLRETLDEYKLAQ